MRVKAKVEIWILWYNRKRGSQIKNAILTFCVRGQILFFFDLVNVKES